MSDETSFSVVCPRCGSTYSVPLQLLGKKAQCPGCSAKFAMEPPPGPQGRELLAQFAKMNEGKEPENVIDSPEDGQIYRPGSVKIPLRGQAKPTLSTSTVKLARFKKGNIELNAALHGQDEEKPKVNADALKKALAEQHEQPTHHSISSGVKAAPAAEKKPWWKIW